MGTVGRLFGALISKAGIPVPTEITQKVGLSRGRLRRLVAAAEFLAKMNKRYPNLSRAGFVRRSVHWPGTDFRQWF